MKFIIFNKNVGEPRVVIEESLGNILCSNAGTYSLDELFTSELESIDFHRLESVGSSVFMAQSIKERLTSSTKHGPSFNVVFNNINVWVINSDSMSNLTEQEKKIGIDDCAVSECGASFTDGYSVTRDRWVAARSVMKGSSFVYILQKQQEDKLNKIGEEDYIKVFIWQICNRIYELCR